MYIISKSSYHINVVQWWQVPFVDVLNTLSDSNLPLTLLDHEEFGNPNIQTDFRSILSYSPYDNIRRDVCYPSMLVTSSFHDSRQAVHIISLNTHAFHFFI